MKIGLTSVIVQDPIAAFRFYTEVLGFQKNFLSPKPI
ncbi:VOC family protein [Leptospira alstonii]|nr:VOC family protein [Leptospira alstonii]